MFIIVSGLSEWASLRPVVFPRENIFTDMVRLLYSMDTPTNILPSIHVYNSIAAFIAIAKCKALKSKPLVVGGAFILTVSIIAATMFLKQHTVVDVCTCAGIECGCLSSGIPPGGQQSSGSREGIFGS